jgi:hypothetical protein
VWLCLISVTQYSVSVCVRVLVHVCVCIGNLVCLQFCCCLDDKRGMLPSFLWSDTL